MTQEADVVRSLVEMADTLVDDYDVVDLLTGLTDRCVTLLGVSAAGVMLASPSAAWAWWPRPARRCACWNCSSSRAGRSVPGRLPQRRAGHQEGPPGRVWPLAAVLRRGCPRRFRSAVALPRGCAVTLGALNLLSTTRSPIGEADVIVARGFADLAALSILQHRASTEAQRLNEQLSAALTSRIVIEQAKGVISERACIDLTEAFARLRGYARNANLPLTDVARAAVDGTLDPRAWTSARG